MNLLSVLLKPVNRNLVQFCIVVFELFCIIYIYIYIKKEVSLKHTVLSCASNLHWQHKPTLSYMVEATKLQSEQKIDVKLEN
jgi:hypothetical protein